MNCDFFLLPNMTHYHASHSYNLELKYMSKADYTEEKAAQQCIYCHNILYNLYYRKCI
ncbi:MAG: hypothetical protein ACI3Y0_10520 [Prevotella sp.]